jgi:hypothetical protein
MVDRLTFDKADRLVFCIALVFSVAGWNSLFFATLVFGIAANVIAMALIAAKTGRAGREEGVPNSGLFFWRIVSTLFFVAATWRVGASQGYF